MFKLKKLNARGFAHHFLIAIVVVGVAIGGTYYLIASHADTCDGMSDPTSSPASDPASSGCTPTSSPVSPPVTVAPGSPTNPTFASTCSISGIPSGLKPNQSFNAVITITNTGNSAIDVLSTDVTTQDFGQPSFDLGTTSQSAFTQGIGNATVVSSGASETLTEPVTIRQSYSGQYTLAAKVTAVNYGGPATVIYANSSCSQAFSMKVATIKSVTITPGNWQTLAGASIVTDKPEGNVLKLTYKTGIASTSTANEPLAKLKDFVQADLGKSIKVCMTAKAPSSKNNGSGVYVSTTFTTSDSSLGITNTGSSYKTACKDYTEISGTTLSKHEANTKYADAFYSQLNPGMRAAGNTTVYIDHVTVTLE